MEIENFITLLPYYDINIPIQKGKNIVKIQYQTRYNLNQHFRDEVSYENGKVIINLLDQ